MAASTLAKGVTSKEEKDLLFTWLDVVDYSCVLFMYTAQGIYRKRRKNGVSDTIFEYFLKIRRKRLNICADLCYTYNVVYSASEEYILADSGNNIVNNTP